MTRGIKASDIATFLGRPLRGADGEVSRPADLADCGPGDLVFLRRYSEEGLRHVEAGRPALVICDAQSASHLCGALVESENPRLDFIRALGHFFPSPSPIEIHPSAIVHPKAVIGARTAIGPYACLGAQVTIGDDCRIGSGVCIEGDTKIGNRCQVKANSVIGAPGFGFERDEEGIPIHFPHLGKVVLEDDVWIGACSTIERAALGTTRLGENVKVDDLVQIGHQVQVGRNSMITANVVLCGGAIVGAGCWIAPNSVVRERVRIGDGATVAMGAVVVRDVEPKAVVAGVPAKPLHRTG